MNKAAFENEKPLENIVPDGGFCSIFETMACIGDSLASGEFESTNADGSTGYHDMFRYSWIQFMARKCGFTGYNFTRGGMTAKEFNASFGKAAGFEDEDKKAQGYIIALGVNDLYNCRYEVGSVADIDFDNFENNAGTFAGEYAKIIQKIKKMQPKARIFLVTMPNDCGRTKGVDQARTEEVQRYRAAQGALLHEFAKIFEFTYVIDLTAFAPVYDDDFRDFYFLGGHMNPMGYKFTADMIASYIDYIIRHNPEDFKQVGFIGKPFHSAKARW